MSLALFDLDNTLLMGDSDHAWGEFLVAQQRVDGERYRAKNDEYLRLYQAGQLDIMEFLAFALEPLAQIERAELDALHTEFMQRCIEPMILPAAEALLAQHREQGDTLLIITATNRFVTGPIAERLGVHHLLATEPEEVDGQYTGRVSGTPCFQQGKVERLHQWLASREESLADSWFYSDSINDLPLLEQVTYPVAIDADAKLSAIATARGWPNRSLRT